MEEEDKINIEEATVNLSCVKKELEEFEFVENRYRIALTYENIFGDTLEEKRKNIDSLIGFLDDDVIMETEMGTIKLEDVKDEDRRRKIIEQSSCNKCCGNYEGYCSNCSSISHILNNVTPNINLQSDLNTIPIGILEIREISMRSAVFALKTIPEGVILGPFEGIAPIKGMNGLKWKIKNKKFINDQNANWMKYIKSVANPLSKNLDIFQFEGLLYFETSREIQEGEELLVCYCEEKEVLKSENDDESYLVPVVKEKFSKVFACVLCCLGFCLEQCLVEHKSKCPQGDHGSSIEDFEIIQCQYCKVWLEKQEHLKGHKLYCQDNYKLRHEISDFQRKSTNEISKTRENRKLSTPINDDRTYLSQTTVIHSKYTDGIGEVNEKAYFIENKHKCSKCHFQTNRKLSLKEHFNTHNDKQIECKKRFPRKTTLKKHIKNQHSNISEKKQKCSVRSYQMNYKSNLKAHFSTHDTKPLECDICKNRFTLKSSLNRHIRIQHTNTSEKEYKCSQCSYQTNYKCSLKKHVNTHSDIKLFECDICRNRFSFKSSLKEHVKIRHSNTNEKEYKCNECSYQTNYKRHLKYHLNTHKDIKPFECDICKNRFSFKSSLKEHMKNRHSNASEKEYKCSECLYQTNRKGNLKIHLNTHKGIKLFECDICKSRFSIKSSLKEHVKTQHSNTSENEHSNASEKEHSNTSEKCSECPYQTNRKSSLRRHLNTHIKPFECGICKNRFSIKSRLKEHIKNRHSNTSEKEYKCSECPYQTNRKGDLKTHLNTHKDIKPFECDICKNRFSFKSNLKMHVKDRHSSTNEKEYKCSGCPYQTNRKTNLSRHLKDHHSNTNEKEYKCSECSFQTNYKHHLKGHLMIHTAVKPFECDICKNRFSIKSNLKRHILNRHTNTSEKKNKLIRKAV